MAGKVKSAEREDGVRARQRILDSAEFVFAEEGYSGASMRQILVRAGANVAAGHYHFGTKHKLYQAVIARYMEPLNKERLSTLEKISTCTADKSDPHLVLTTLIKAYIAPHLRLTISKRGRCYVKLIARFLVENEDVTRPIYSQHIAPLREAFGAIFYKLFPHLSEKKLGQCFELIALTMSGRALRGLPRPLSKSENEKRIDELVTYLAGGITAFANQ